MFTISNIQWSVAQINKMMSGKGRRGSAMRFDDALQRDTVWKLPQKQLFMDSILRGYPIPPLYAERYTDEDENNEAKRSYSVLDGKQRCTTLKAFLDNEFKLADDADPVEDDEDELVEIAGMTYDDLPEDLQQRIRDKTLTVYYLDNMSEDEKAEMFYRLNNGVALTAIEKSRVRAVSREKITKLATENTLFTNNFSDKQIKHYATEDIVFKSWMMLHVDRDEICLDNKYVRPLMETTEITDEEIAELDGIFDYIESATEFITGDLNKKTAKKLVTRTNLITVVPIVKNAMENNYDSDQFAEWFETFFPESEESKVNNKGKTIKTWKCECVSSKYDEAAKSGANHHEQVVTRLSEMESSWAQYKAKCDMPDSETTELANVG